MEIEVHLNCRQFSSLCNIDHTSCCAHLSLVKYVTQRVQRFSINAKGERKEIHMNMKIKENKLH